MQLAEAVVHRHVDGPAAVIGDIHGESELLARLLEALGDRALVVLGDLGDRGPDTRGVLDRLAARGACGVLGNHDLWLRGWARGSGFDPFALSEAMGGEATLASYGVVGREPDVVAGQGHRVPGAHRELLDRLGVVMDLQVGDQAWWLIHAGLAPTLVRPWMVRTQVVPFLASTNPLPLLWSKTDPAEVPAMERPILMGHVPLEEPEDHGHVVALDTGAGRGGRLTALLLPERELVSVGP